MTTVVIEPAIHNGSGYRAMADDRESFGATRGAALDALFERLEGADKSSSIVVRDFHPDEFFTSEQRYRLDFLMRKLDRATNAGTEFTARDMAELENLIEAELDGAVRRAESMSKPIG